MKQFINVRPAKDVDFMGEKLSIKKLTIAQVKEIQTVAADVNNNDGLLLIKKVIRAGVDSAAELQDEDFDKMPLGDLTQLSTEIMSFSGLTGDAGK